MSVHPSRYKSLFSNWRTAVGTILFMGMNFFMFLFVFSTMAGYIAALTKFGGIDGFSAPIAAAMLVALSAPIVKFH